MSLQSETSLLSYALSSTTTLEAFEKMLSHKLRFRNFLRHFHSLDRDETFNEEVTSLVVNYLDFSGHSFDSKLSSKSFKEKARKLLSTNFANILSLSVYENWIGLNYSGDPFNHRFILYSILCSKNPLADALIRIFSMFQINLSDRKVVDTIVVPSYYRYYNTGAGYECVDVYEDANADYIVEREYIFSHGRNLIDNYSVKLELSTNLYYKMKIAGFNFDRQICFDGEYRDLLTRFLMDDFDQDAVQFFYLYLANSKIQVNEKWFSIIADKFHSLEYFDFGVIMDKIFLYDCVLVAIAKMNPILYKMNYGYELIAFPLVMKNGFSVFRNKSRAHEVAFQYVFECFKNRGTISKLRGLQLLEQIVKHIDVDIDISTFLIEENNHIHTIGKVCFSFLCELKKYLIRYKKEKMIPFIDDVKLNCPGYALSNHRENLTFYYGEGAMYPIAECDIFDNETFYPESSYDYY